jgi:hypothetical protein
MDKAASNRSSASRSRSIALSAVWDVESSRFARAACCACNDDTCDSKVDFSSLGFQDELNDQPQNN